MSQAKRLATDVIFLNKGKVLEQTISKTFFHYQKCRIETGAEFDTEFFNFECTWSDYN